MTPDSYDALVIGGSWAGLSAAMQLARARRRVLVVDTGRPRNRFAHHAHGFLGQDGRPPAEIRDAARAQVLAYPTAEFREDEATHAQAEGDGFVVRLASGAAIRARRLVLATGVIDELPDVPGVRERWGATVLHCPYCHGYEVAGRRIGVLATTPHSVHQALLLPDWSDDVTFFTNGVVAPDETERAKLAARGVKIDARPVESLVGDPRTPDSNAITGVRVAGGDVVPVEALFLGPRTRVASPLAEQLGCAFDEGPSGLFVRTTPRKETTVPGVFAAGDAALAAHNASFASADGVMAGVAAHQSLALA